jgi:hypothetical protein
VIVSAALTYDGDQKERTSDATLAEAHEPTGELRLIITDYHDGRHDRDEFAPSTATAARSAPPTCQVHGLPSSPVRPGKLRYTIRTPTYGHLPVNVGPTRSAPRTTPARGGEPAP